MALNQEYKLDYQIQHLIVLHAYTDLKGKTLLEIGGALPNELLFNLFDVENYINLESPDYIDAEHGNTYNSKFGLHERKKTIFKNAEDIDSDIEDNSIDIIFSTACFEHIYDLKGALNSCYKVSKKDGFLYSFFAPIYSYLSTGSHGVIPLHPLLKDNTCGLHLLRLHDQRQFLISHGVNDPDELQTFLGAVNFNRIPNRLYYEDYIQILTESPYHVIKLDDASPDFNISKRYPEEVARVRESNPKLGNLHSQGFRAFLRKSN